MDAPTWWHQSARPSVPVSEAVSLGASTLHAATTPPSPTAAKRSPHSLNLTCILACQVLRHDVVPPLINYTGAKVSY